jgi:hypothetical protein
MTTLVAGRRHAQGNLDSLLPRGGSKVDLADRLWPTLETKIRNAIGRATESRIPIVRVLDEAVALAYEYPRQGLVMSLTSRRAASTST